MLEVLCAGLQTIVVDRGRFGYRHIGVGVGGALDAHAYATANELVENGAGEAALEISYGNFGCRFTHATRFSLTGADCGATLNGVPIAAWQSYDAQAGEELTLFVPQNGVRTYLALDCGIDVTPVMGSRSTDLRGGFGGWNGRALRSGDVLPLAESRCFGGATRGAPPRIYGEELIVRAIARRASSEFWQRAWRVSYEANRMGCRLLGKPLAGGAEAPSHAVFPGVVQLPPNGEPIVLLADAQTTGGYLPIASVLTDDLDGFAQLRAGALVRFREVDGDAH